MMMFALREGRSLFYIWSIPPNSDGGQIYFNFIPVMSTSENLIAMKQLVKTKTFTRRISSLILKYSLKTKKQPRSVNI